MARHIETVDAWNLKTSTCFNPGRGVSNSNINTFVVPMQFLQNAPYSAMNTSTRDAHKLWDKKNIPQTGELGDVVGRPLPHGMLDTSEDPKSPDWCVPESFSICQSLPGGAWGGVRFRGDPTGLTLLRCKYERKLFLKSWKLCSASWKLFFKSPIFLL